MTVQVKWKHKTLPPGYSLVSFDVVSLFTNVPLNKTIDIILRHIYDDKELQTKIPRKDLKELFILCTKHVYFTFNNETYIQTDGVAMCSPLGSILRHFHGRLRKNSSPNTHKPHPRLVKIR